MKKSTVSLCVLILSLLFFTNFSQAQSISLSTPADGSTGVTGNTQFTWNVVGSFSGNYTVQISNNLSFSNIIYSTTTSNQFKNINISVGSGFTGGTTYAWRVINGTVYSNVFQFSTDPALPVELASFSASVDGNTITLKWSTATEVNNYGFDIERNNGAGWAKIGFVAGSGNSNSPNNYSYVDQLNGGSSFSYRLKQIDNDGTFKYYDAITVTLAGGDKVELLQNSPNPFNPTTSIKYYVPQAMDVTITIYDILGREVTKIVNNQVAAGYHVVYWNGKDSFGNSASSGVYLYRLSAGNFTETKKMNLMK